MENFILEFHQGTTSSKALIFDKSGNIRAFAQKEFSQYFPNPGWVEHDLYDIWSSRVVVAAEAVSGLGIKGSQQAGIGITKQREKTLYGIGLQESLFTMLSSGRTGIPLSIAMS